MHKNDAGTWPPLRGRLQYVKQKRGLGKKGDAEHNRIIDAEGEARILTHVKCHCNFQILGPLKNFFIIISRIRVAYEAGGEE